MHIGSTLRKPPWPFFGLVYILSVPFWIVGAIDDGFLQKTIGINLPTSALMFCTPVIAASLLSFSESGRDGVKKLLKRAADYRKIRPKSWYIPILALMPITMCLEYGIMHLAGMPLPNFRFPALMLPFLTIVFLITAAGEEIGWQGYAIDRLQERWNALEAGIILGAVWAVLHVIPDIQGGHTVTWIVWHRLGTIVLRILTIWLYNNTAGSVFATILFHATQNISVFSFPNYGSHYDPFIAFLITAFMAAIIVFVWGPQTLARYRFARSSGHDANG